MLFEIAGSRARFPAQGDCFFRQLTRDVQGIFSRTVQRELLSFSLNTMVTVANCYDIHEAFRLQLALGAADIPSFIPDEATAQNVPYFFIGSGAGVRLQVAEEHATDARQIISSNREVPEIRENKRSHEDEDEEVRY
jgi:hypothetical protein